MLTVANRNTRKHVIDRTTVYTAIYGRKQMVIYGITPYRNCNRKPSLKVLDGYNYGPRIMDLYDASVRCTVTSPMDGWLSTEDDVMKKYIGDFTFDDDEYSDWTISL